MPNNKVIVVKDTPVKIIEVNEQDYISLTDMVRNMEEGSVVIEKWLRNKNTIEFIGIWEKINNSAFNSPEFGGIMMEAGLNRFTLSVKKWIVRTNAIGLIAKTGRFNSGTYAHKDIAFEFGSWLSAEFKLYLIKEFQRLKDEENKTHQLEWNLQRTLSKINYRIHTDAIKETLIPPQLTRQQTGTIYASEADLLNMALFGKTAAEWRKENPGKTGNIRDEATLEQLVVLSNLESINAVLLRQELPQSKRLEQLNEIAISQIKSLLANNSMKKLKQ
ncbi:KilA-N domain-containing protein [Niastella populi]|uniref:DNA-binding protein n=1 Tax=Niastella populi TaxID=550983 RepID=A0A1V9G3B3_9BACT|nr:KilA-N domain-containing protein [Niastella populi]OQP65077.1 DNA-binding protein [Niastella populi]